MKSNIKKNFRIQKLHERNLFFAQNHKRDIYIDNSEFLVHHWSGKAATFSPATGETAASADEKINICDHNCAFFLDHSPVTINPRSNRGRFLLAIG